MAILGNKNENKKKLESSKEQISISRRGSSETMKGDFIRTMRRNTSGKIY